MILDYYNALERLKTNKPNVVEKGSKITKASVAREAGRDPSAIKASRAEFATLIQEIEKAAEKRAKPVKEMQLRYEKMKISRDDYKLRYEETLARELCLVRHLENLEAQSTKANVPSFGNLG